MEAISIDSNNWLMHYPTLRLVNQCRRIIHAEFGVRLHLSDPELRYTLAWYAGHSRSMGLQNVYAELRLRLIELEGPDEPSGEGAMAENQRPKRMYRGRPLPEPDSGAAEQSDKDTARENGSERTQTIVYRGRTLKRD